MTWFSENREFKIATDILDTNEHRMRRPAFMVVYLILVTFKICQMQNINV